MLKVYFFIALLVGSLAVEADPIFPSNWMSLGNINGKFFLYDKSLQMTWRDARTICEDNGMTLAEIMSQEEENFLKYRYETGQFDGGGRDVLSDKQFIWDKSEGQIRTSLRWYSFQGPNTCVLYHANGYLESTDCTHSNAYPMCHTF